VGADEGFISESAAVKRSDGKPNSFLDGVIHVRGENEKKHVVREERNDEGVDKEEFLVERELLKERAVEGEAVAGLGDRRSEHLLQSDIPANRDAQVGSVIDKGKVRPGAASEEGANGEVVRRVK
jgi:hypothetical protein